MKKQNFNTNPEISHWYEDIYRSAVVSRNRLFLAGIIAMVITALSVIAVILLVPLKQVEPYVIQVAENGATTVLEPLKDKKLTETEALSKFFLVKYVVARETYDPQDLNRHYESVRIMSSPAEATRFDDYLRGEDSPIERFQRSVTRRVRVISVSFLNQKTAQVRFRTTETHLNETTTDHWIGTLSFRYLNSPMEEKERFENPLGFQVAAYRIDQEVIK